MYVTAIYIHTRAYVCMYVCGHVGGRGDVGNHKCARVRSELRTHARVLRARLRVRARELTRARARERMYANDPCFGVVARVRGSTYVCMYVCHGHLHTYAGVCMYVRMWPRGRAGGCGDSQMRACMNTNAHARACVGPTHARACTRRRDVRMATRLRRRVYRN